MGWYEVAQDSMRVTTRVITKKIEVAVTRRHVFHGEDPDRSLSRIGEAEGELADLVVLSLAATFERTLRDFMTRRADRLLGGDPLDLAIHAAVVSDIEILAARRSARLRLQGPGRTDRPRPGQADRRLPKLGRARPLDGGASGRQRKPADGLRAAHSLPDRGGHRRSAVKRGGPLGASRPLDGRRSVAENRPTDRPDRARAVGSAATPSVIEGLTSMALRFPARTTRAALPAAALALIAAAAWGDVTYVSPSMTRLKEDVGFLAADAQEGRAPGSKGIEASADHIAAAFKDAGLKPAPGAEGFYQPFSIRGDAALAALPALAFKGPGGQEIAPEKGAFQPLAIGGSATMDGLPVAFAGYGISAKDDAKKLDYDDYAGLDVKGKAVLVIRREPQLDDEKSPFAGKQTTKYAAFVHKVTNAFQHGAAALLIVNDTAGLKGNADQLLRINGAGSEENSPIPVVMLKREEADQLLAAAGQPKLETIEKEIDGDLKPRSRILEGWSLSGSVRVERKGLQTRNVIGVLEGAGPTAEETIVVGAHYDHLGHGGLASGSLAMFSRDIHNGADDNASGTALVIELARRLAKRADPLPRRVVFMAFSGEEKGLLGSRHYVEHPLIPLDKTVMMINFDMVGRLNEKAELTVVGTGSTTGIEEIVDALGAAAGFKIKKVKGMTDGFGGSDHESFYLKNVPILFPFTGLHADYHRPTDDTERINFAGLARIADFGELLLLDLARRPTRPEFTKVAERPKNPHGEGNADPGRVGMGAYLGTVPDYGAEDKGVKLSAVREGSPAEKGGIRGGDVIVGFAGKPISSIYDYTDNLGRAKPGDQVDVVVKRDGKDVTLKVTLGSRPGQ